MSGVSKRHLLHLSNWLFDRLGTYYSNSLLALEVFTTYFDRVRVSTSPRHCSAWIPYLLVPMMWFYGVDQPLNQDRTQKLFLLWDIGSLMAHGRVCGSETLNMFRTWITCMIFPREKNTEKSNFCLIRTKTRFGGISTPLQYLACLDATMLTRNLGALH